MKEINKKRSTKKTFILDIMLNVVGTGIALVVLQVFIYPLIARKISSDAYGEMQTAMSLIYLIGGVIGDGLAATRLLNDIDYKKKKIRGDFNYINFINILLVIISSVFFFVFYLHTTDIETLVFRVIICLMNYLLSYMIVGFRLSLDYKGIFVDNIINCLGYILGYMFFLFTLKWEFVILISYLLRLIYYFNKYNLLKEPLRKTVKFKESFKQFTDLSIANFLNKILTYFDKILLYPLLGGTAVSIYFAANLFGKLMLQILNPITNVMLSYLAKSNTVHRSIWRITVIIGGIGCIVMYCLCLLISYPVLNLFYPQWADAAISIVPITTATLAISSFYSLLYPLFLKTLKTRAQIIINSSGIIAYIIISLMSFNRYGIVGCSIALLISYLVKLIISTILYNIHKNVIIRN